MYKLSFLNDDNIRSVNVDICLLRMLIVFCTLFNYLKIYWLQFCLGCRRTSDTQLHIYSLKSIHVSIKSERL